LAPEFFVIYQTLFNYRQNVYGLALNLVVVIALGVSIGIVSAWKGHFQFGFLFATAWLLFFLPLSVITVLRGSTIAASERTIQLVVFGYVWRSINWNDVQRIQVIPVVSFTKQTWVSMYCAEKRRDHPRC
jgi:hypothetical protein